MDKSEIVMLIHFNFWANDRIVAASEPLSAEEFRGKVKLDPGWGDLRSILVHILDTEYGWRNILQSQKADDILEATDFANVLALNTRWEIEKSAWLAYATGLSEESINKGYGADNRDGQKVWQTIIHVVTHGIQHRSEAATILTGYGQSPGELDFDVFLKEKIKNP